jgi:NAD(P)-dependent dehydrogenase (short-subunit alcohol dehydrogenase family)
MAQPLAGKTALVTGAARGIGRAIALRLARDGALVAVHYGNSRQAAEDVVASIGQAGGAAFAVQADVRSVAAIAAMFDVLDAEFTARTGSNRIDILVNNAGVGTGMMRLEDTTEEAFDLLFDTNFKGLFFVTKHAVPRLRDGGKVVNVSSTSTRGAMAALPAYAASKTPINSFTLSLAEALGPRRIAVNAVLPGLVETDLTTHLRSNPVALEASVRSCAFGRTGQPEDISGAVALLVSPDAGWINGQIIEVSGGARL